MYWYTNVPKCLVSFLKVNQKFSKNVSVTFLKIKRFQKTYIYGILLAQHIRWIKNKSKLVEHLSRTSLHSAVFIRCKHYFFGKTKGKTPNSSVSRALDFKSEDRWFDPWPGTHNMCGNWSRKILSTSILLLPLIKVGQFFRFQYMLIYIEMIVYTSNKC